MVFLYVNVVIVLVCTVQLPVGHAVLRGIFKVSVELKEARCTQHTAIFPLGKRGAFPLAAHTPY